jgi:hypothetical protein
MVPNQLKHKLGPYVWRKAENQKLQEEYKIHCVNQRQIILEQD